MVIRTDDILIDRKTLTIQIGDRIVQFNGYGGRPKRYAKDKSVAFVTISHLLLQPWLTREKLFDLVYGHHSDGGPDNGWHIFDIHFIHWKNHFKNLGLKLIRDKRGGVMHFAFRRISHG